jgi:molecular chaperone DnaK
VLEESLAELEIRLARSRTEAESSTGALDQLAMLDVQDKVGTCRDMVRIARTDLGAARDAEEKIRELHAALDEIEDASRLPVLIRELQDAVNECASLIERSGRDGDQRELPDLRDRADAAIAARDAKAMRVQLDRAGKLIAEFLRERPDWPIIVFRALREMRWKLHPMDQADALIRQGQQALDAGDLHALAVVNDGLRRLIPPDITDPTGYLVPM